MATELEREAIRVYRRYSAEVVEALGVCPWAHRARKDGRVRERVLLEPVTDLRRTVEAVRELGADRRVDIGLLLFPCLAIDRDGFERFVAQVREAYAEGEPGSVAMALAAFHPRAEPDLGSPERLVPFLRRTPDPTVQLVRRSVLAQVRRAHGHGTGFVDPRTLLDVSTLLGGEPRVPLHERVAANNLETVQRMGVERLEAIFEDIRRDRDRSYEALGVNRSAWAASGPTAPSSSDADASGGASA